MFALKAPPPPHSSLLVGFVDSGNRLMGEERVKFLIPQTELDGARLDSMDEVVESNHSLLHTSCIIPNT